MKKAMGLILIFLFLLTPSVLAQDKARDNVWQAAQSEVYGTKAGGMLGRGLLNAVTCFVDVIVHVADGTKAGPPLVGTLTGLGSGIACTALRATSGVLDVATFWVPGFNGIPVSRSYHNCLEEEELAASQEATAPPAEEPAPFFTSPAPEDYAKPAEPKKHDVYDYVKK